MIDNYVNINTKKDILKIGLKDENDKPILDEKGEVVFWQFDLGDIELPLKYNQCEREHRKNQQDVRMRFIAIDKKEDVKGKYLLSRNEEEKLKVLKDYYCAEEKTLNLFLGDNGVKKFLNGRNYYWDMFEDISEVLKPVLPLFENSLTSISDRIKDKYSKKEENVIE